MSPSASVTEGDENQLLETLRAEGSRANNGTLQGVLRWETNRYWEARNKLLDKGVVGKARGGPGGTTYIVEQPLVEAIDDASAIGVPAQPAGPYPDEASLYEPLRDQIEKNWAKSEAYDQFIVTNTARLGRRPTGGNWTRPDICLIGIRKFKFIRNPVADVVTFEVKPKTDVTVKGVLEALSHRQASTVAYVIFNIFQKMTLKIIRRTTGLCRLLKGMEWESFLPLNPKTKRHGSRSFAQLAGNLTLRTSTALFKK